MQNVEKPFKVEALFNFPKVGSPLKDPLTEMLRSQLLTFLNRALENSVR